MDKHMADSLDHWLTTPPEESQPDPDDVTEMDAVSAYPPCTVNTPHDASECNGVHYDESDT